MLLKCFLKLKTSIDDSSPDYTLIFLCIHKKIEYMIIDHPHRRKKENRYRNYINGKRLNWLIKQNISG